MISIATDKAVDASLHIPDQQVIFIFVNAEQSILHPGIAAVADAAPDQFGIAHIAAFSKAADGRLPVKKADIFLSVVRENVFLRKLGRQLADVSPAGNQVFLCGCVERADAVLLKVHQGDSLVDVVDPAEELVQVPQAL